MIRTTVAILFLCSACRNQPTQPWFGDVAVLPSAGAILSARYDTDDQLHVLAVYDGGVHHGVLDDDSREFDFGPAIQVVLDGSIVPFEGTVTPNRLHLAHRPDSDEVWVRWDGQMGPLAADGTVDVQLTYGVQSPAQAVEGGFAFIDADTLAVAAGLEAGIVSLSDPETVTPFATPTPRACSMDVAGGFLALSECGGIPRVYEAETGLASVITAEQAASEGLADGTFGGRPIVAGIGANGGVTGGGINALCGGPTLAGHVVHTVEIFQYSSTTCDDFVTGPTSPLDGDVRDDGGQLALFYGVSPGVILYDRDPPSRRERDIEGLWCQNGLQLNLVKGEPPVFPGGSTASRLFNDISWSYDGTVLTFKYRSPSGENVLPDVEPTVGHWALRTGDVLHMQSYAKDVLDNVARDSFTGLWTPCAN